MVVRNLVKWWRNAIQSAYDQAIVSSMYTRAATVCLQCGEKGLAQAVVRDMQANNVDIDDQLVAAVKE